MRVETGVRAGDSISPFYDPMIAKLVVHAADRQAALAALSERAGRNRSCRLDREHRLSGRAGGDPDFAAGDVDTGLIGRHQDALTALPAPTSLRCRRRGCLPHRALPTGRLRTIRGRRLGGYAHFQGLEREVRLKYGDHDVPARLIAAAAMAVAIRLYGDTIRLGSAPTSSAWRAGRDMSPYSTEPSAMYSRCPTRWRARTKRWREPATCARRCPVWSSWCALAKGESVTKGQPLLILEAMKMEHTIVGPA